jgi:hypothetical protein
MPTNQYLPFATSGSANIFSYATYAARGEVLTGVVSGKGSSTLSNTTWRQASVIASAVAQVICDTTGTDMLDDGIVANVVTKFKQMLAATLVTSVPPIFTGSAAASAVNTVMATLSPVMTSYTPEAIYLVKMANTCGGPTQAQFNNIAAAPIAKANGQALTGLEWYAGDVVALTYDGASFRLLNDKTVSTSITLTATTQAQLNAMVIGASQLVISSAATFNINVGAGQFAFTSITGPLLFHHPFGQRINIIGAPLTGSWPTRAMFVGKTAAQCLAIWQGIIPTQFTSVGTEIVKINDAALGSFQNVLLSGDGTNSGGFYGLKVSDWSTVVGRASTQLVNVALHGFGLDGLRVEMLGAVQMNNVAATYCTRAGIWFSHGSIGEVNTGNILGMFSKYGIACQNTGAVYIDSASGTVDFTDNNTHNIYLSSMGKFDSQVATGVRIINAGQWGLFSQFQSQCNLGSGVTFSGNASGDMYADVASINTAIGSSVGTASPTANSGLNARGAANYK